MSPCRHASESALAGRHEAMRAIVGSSAAVVLLLAVGAAAQEKVAAAGAELLARLSANIPAEELAPDRPDPSAEASRAAALLAREAEGVAACARACAEANTLLDGLCERVVQPTAARSKATCYARAVELVAQCEARCAGE